MLNFIKKLFGLNVECKKFNDINVDVKYSQLNMVCNYGERWGTLEEFSEAFSSLNTNNDVVLPYAFINKGTDRYVATHSEPWVNENGDYVICQSDLDRTSTEDLFCGNHAIMANVTNGVVPSESKMVVARPFGEEVHIWPDGTFCVSEDLEDFINIIGDDYKSHTIPVHALDIKALSEMVCVKVNGELSDDDKECDTGRSDRYEVYEKHSIIKLILENEEHPKKYMDTRNKILNLIIDEYQVYEVEKPINSFEEGTALVLDTIDGEKEITKVHLTDLDHLNERCINLDAFKEAFTPWYDRYKEHAKRRAIWLMR